MEKPSVTDNRSERQRCYDDLIAEAYRSSVGMDGGGPDIDLIDRLREERDEYSCLPIG